MKKITENALLFRVNQLKEKMAMIEAAVSGRGSIPDTATMPHGRGAYVPPSNQTGTAPKPSTGESGIPGGVVDQAVSGQYTPAPMPTVPAAPANTQTQTAPPAGKFQPAPMPTIPPLNQLANPANTGAGPRAAPGALAQAKPSAPAGTAPKPGAPAQAKWPETPEEIKAFQQAHKGLDGQPLKVDGLIGPQTMQSLAKSGYKQPPAGFKMANAKQPTAPASGAAAKPATPGQASQGKVSDPKVVELQKKLIAQGWPLKPDGIMGPDTEQAYQAQFKTDSMNASMQPAAAPAAAPAATPAATPAAPAPAGAAAITPTFQSQQAPAAQPSSEWDQNDPNTPSMFRNPLPGEPGMHESVSFKNEDSLARILQLANWR